MNSTSSVSSSPDVSGSHRLLWINIGLLILLWAFTHGLAERFWLSGFLCYMPLHLLVLPTLYLLARAAWKRAWKIAGAHALCLGAIAHVFLGFQVPLRHLLSATGQRTSGTAPRAGLRVATYNVLGARRGVGKVAGVLRELDADVLCLQEADLWKSETKRGPDPLRDLTSRLPGYHVARAAEVATLSRFPILAQRALPFPAPSTRFVLETVLATNNGPLRVLNIHPATIAITGRTSPSVGVAARVAQSLRVRDGQIAVLLRAVDSPPVEWHSSWKSAPVVLAGDFNTPPRGRTYGRLAARWGDSWREAGWGAGDTYHSDFPVVRIDYVWRPRGWKTTQARVVEGLARGGLASDHRALVVDLEPDAP